MDTLCGADPQADTAPDTPLVIDHDPSDLIPALGPFDGGTKVTTGRLDTLDQSYTFTRTLIDAPAAIDTALKF